jgi:hypothetical protein
MIFLQYTCCKNGNTRPRILIRLLLVLQPRSKRTVKGQQLPTCRPASDVSAVEAALRASAGKTTAQIFYPSTGIVFDSLEEAYEFYNLYSWEAGFGIRYGSSNTNQGNRYRTKQIIECGNAVCVRHLAIYHASCYFSCRCMLSDDI